ncbi:hypothetical protein Barb7_01579 [Bacteroidales bacterium Barb7]|nr:hypothetical protein Barb7_01579 [Bacteroidales bacterium Barb7]
MGEKKDNSCPPVLHRWLCTFYLSFKKNKKKRNGCLCGHSLYIPSLYFSSTDCLLRDIFRLSMPDVNGEAITLPALCLPGDKGTGE